jgi:hypothetical protein
MKMYRAGIEKRFLDVVLADILRLAWTRNSSCKR